MTPVEKLAIQLSRVYFDGDPGPWMTLSLDTRVMLRRLARHVLRRERAAVRRAKGRTIGWIVTNSDGHLFDEFLSKTEDGARAEREDEIKYGDTLLARVVAVPKRKGGRRD